MKVHSKILPLHHKNTFSRPPRWLFGNPHIFCAIPGRARPIAVKLTQDLLFLYSGVVAGKAFIARVQLNAQAELYISCETM